MNMVSKNVSTRELLYGIIILCLFIRCCYQGKILSDNLSRLEELKSVSDSLVLVNDRNELRYKESRRLDSLLFLDIDKLKIEHDTLTHSSIMSYWDIPVDSSSTNQR